ncbi:hypothetical protein Poli38472_011770 [Pythium oligandrum]|uniref:Globin domain-containing protein n=1 Tax=Pythium oligandrum TaxID=41045 RepID=A0A8K1C910_PYTOL|nr:hypothetical protein Poli38472_011770 [Pythium oligandrum]|eukprot:TMW58182.1 hypothetical protein Poli38472_011770 [Pythium oligandrum]
MGCVHSHHRSVAPDKASTSIVPSETSTCRPSDTSASKPRLRRIRSKRGKKLPRDQIQLLKTYLPSVPYYFESTAHHREIAGAHWTEVYRQGNGSGSSKRSQNSWGRDTTNTQNSTLTLLYDMFYQYLEQYSPELMPVFRASMHVRSKVLVHISAGMRSILAAENLAEKVQALTKTHLQVGVKLVHYEPLAKALFFAMEATSGDQWTPLVADAWRSLFAHCSAILMVEQKRTQTQQTKSNRSKKNLTESPSIGDLYTTPKNMSIRERTNSRLQSLRLHPQQH